MVIHVVPRMQTSFDDGESRESVMAWRSFIQYLSLQGVSLVLLMGLKVGGRGLGEKNQKA
jgi:hypothetical protein